MNHRVGVHRVFSEDYSREFSFFLLPSTGFSASLGINQTRLNFTAPGMRPTSQSFCTRLAEIPHFAAASAQDTYSIVAPSFLLITYHDILYTVERTISIDKP